MTVHLLDHKDKATAEAGVTGNATVVTGAFSETIALTAQANGVLTGTGKFPESGTLKVSVVAPEGLFASGLHSCRGHC